MTGPLTLSGDPAEDLQAAPKQYVDALKPKPITITLPASGWSGNQQTVAATGVTADNAVTPSPAPASWEAAGDAGFLKQWAMNLMLMNVATRKFGRAVRLPAEPAMTLIP